MKNKNLWVDLSILNLCIVAFLGFTLRSKMIFALPWINYLYLLDAHSHFAFEGWITLALMLLLVQELLPVPFTKRSIYQGSYCALVLSAYGIFLTMLFNNNSFLAGFFPSLFILVTYIFGWMFLDDIRKSPVNKTTFLLSVSAIISLVVSSAGPFTLMWLHATKSMNATLYRDASYFYLHLLYNGFFSLTVFALLFNKLYPKISKKTQQNFHLFAILICLSIFPSLFLSFLWQDPNHLFHIMALTGSILIFLSVGWFILSALPLLKYSTMGLSPVRYILILSIGAFILKMFLQGLTIFPVLGNAVFGDRPVIIGYLHLIFLGFVTPFILAYYLQKDLLNIKIKLTVYGIIVLMAGVACNEITLLLQGLGAMFLKGSVVYSWLLWVISICLMIGAILIFTARIKSRVHFQVMEKA